MVAEILAYKEILNNILTIVKNCPYKTEYLIAKMGMASSTFYNKLKNQSFSVDEMLTLSQYLEPEEYEHYLIMQSVAKSREQFASGEYFTTDEVVAEIRNKYGLNEA